MLLHTIEHSSPDNDRLCPVVLLHGLFGRARNLGFLQRALSAKRRVLALDLRNHGSSPHGSMDYVKMVEDVVETLSEKQAVPSIFFGHSMGGKVAMLLALMFPDLVHGLLVGDMAPAPTGHGQGAIGEELRRLELPCGLDRNKANTLLKKITPRQDVRDLILQNLQFGAQPKWEIGLNEIVNAMPNIESWPYIPEGHCYEGPTLFLKGARSPYIEPKHQQVMRQLFPHHELTTIEDAGHWLHVDQPRAFLKEMELFIDKL